MNDILKGEAEYFGGIIQELQEQNKQYREAYNYLKESIKGQSYVCHYKCQDVISVTDLKEGLYVFEELEGESK